MGILKQLIWIMFLILAGCSTATTVRISDYVTDVPTNPKKIEIFFQNAPRKARPIAVVAVARNGENSAYAVERLKDEAAKIGADAIINLDMSYTSGWLPNLRVSGVAVKYE